jgi:uncharacterized coiled-coil protein SlyX
MKEVLSSNIARSQNGEHFNYGTDFLSAFTAAFAAKVKLTKQREQLKLLHDKMGEVYIRNRAFEQTATIVELDHERDEQFKGFRAAITYYQKLGTAPQKAAAKSITYLLKPYQLAAGLSYTNNTAQLSKFILDVTSDTYAPHLVTLNMTDAVDRLKTSNEEFVALYSSRSEDLLDRTEHEKIRTLRHEWDTVYHEVVRILPVLHYMEEDATKREEIGDVIDEINAFLIQLRKILERRGVKSSSGNAAEDENNGETPPSEVPEEPENPGDDTPGGDSGSGGPLD